MTIRTGLIIPSSNRMVEDEMVRFYPQGVRPHITRLRMTGANNVPLPQLLPRISEAAAALADARCAAITFHCTANSTADGTAGEQAILDAVGASGVQHPSSTATAIRRAIEALGARSLVLVTPYSQAVTDHEAEFFAGIGVEVLSAIGHGLANSDAYCTTPPSFWLESTLAARHPKADLYFVSCANIAAFSVIDELERRLERPVITSNQAVIWDQLKRLGVSGMGTCPGRLIAH